MAPYKTNTKGTFKIKPDGSEHVPPQTEQQTNPGTTTGDTIYDRLWPRHQKRSHYHVRLSLVVLQSWRPFGKKKKTKTQKNSRSLWGRIWDSRLGDWLLLKAHHTWWHSKWAPGLPRRAICVSMCLHVCVSVCVCMGKTRFQDFHFRG